MGNLIHAVSLAAEDDITDMTDDISDDRHDEKILKECDHRSQAKQIQFSKDDRDQAEQAELAVMDILAKRCRTRGLKLGRDVVAIYERSGDCELAGFDDFYAEIFWMLGLCGGARTRSWRNWINGLAGVSQDNMNAAVDAWIQDKEKQSFAYAREILYADLSFPEIRPFAKRAKKLTEQKDL